MGANDGATKKSLFIDVRYYDPDDLVPHLEHVRTQHKDPAKDDYIYNVVLNEIGDEFGNLSPLIYSVLPYLPGGDKQCFDNVFVGSKFLPWNGQGTAYDAGMKDAGFRWANLGIQRTLWDKFAAIFSGPWHGYVTFEGVLDFMDDIWLRQCYEAYLIQSRRDLKWAAGPGKAMLWSPAIWSGRPFTWVEEREIRNLFTNVASYAPPGVTWLHFQDMMGRQRADITLSDVKQWYHEISNAYDFASLRVNMELFNASPQEIQDRQDWYEANGILVGASFEMRHWIDVHAEI